VHLYGCTRSGRRQNSRAYVAINFYLRRTITYAIIELDSYREKNYRSPPLALRLFERTQNVARLQGLRGAHTICVRNENRIRLQSYLVQYDIVIIRIFSDLQAIAVFVNGDFPCGRSSIKTLFDRIIADVCTGLPESELSQLRRKYYILFRYMTTYTFCT